MAMLHPQEWQRAEQRFRERGLRRWMVVIVRGSAAWRPQEWDDEPFDAEPVCTAKRGMRLSRARGFAFGFNTASMDTQTRYWAIVQPDFGRTIDSVGLVSCQNYLRANGL